MAGSGKDIPETIRAGWGSSTVWVSAFLGFSDSDDDAGVALWRALTGYPLSSDDGFLKAQRPLSRRPVVRAHR